MLIEKDTVSVDGLMMGVEVDLSGEKEPWNEAMKCKKTEKNPKFLSSHTHENNKLRSWIEIEMM